MVKIYIINVDFKLNEEEFNKIKKNVNIKLNYKKNQSCISWGLLLLALRLNFGDINLEFDKNIYGKPHIKSHKNFFNISHSYNKAVVAIASQEVGIDVEKIKTHNFNIANKYFSKCERDYIFFDESEEEIKKKFCILWTLKESYLKFKGIGLGNLKNVKFNLHQNEEGEIKFHINNEPDCIFKIYNINDLNEDYIIAYCGLTESVEIINIDKNTLINFLNNI